MTAHVATDIKYNYLPTDFSVQTDPQQDERVYPPTK